ncbi:MAG TPA: ATP synthase F0 subunit B [Terriglobales bacterium]|nr:ATP synthase F0 subunit B [Terriglobales bacterium]
MKRWSIALFCLVLALGLSSSFAQEHGATAPPEHGAQASETSQHEPQGPATGGMKDQLAHASNEAAGHEEDAHAEFKQSASVKMFARLTGLSLTAAYWVLVVINFLIIALLIGWALKKNLPGMFRARTENIRKSLDEARHASEDANRRLTDIEGRLSTLDSEIAELRKTAEADAIAEEERIRAAAEEDRRKIIEMSEHEIEAAAKSARRELKAYAAELAVALAEKRLKVDPKTDEALVRNFVGQLGKDGR